MIKKQSQSSQHTNNDNEVEKVDDDDVYMSEVSQTVSEDDEGAPGEQQYMAAEEDIEPVHE